MASQQQITKVENYLREAFETQIERAPYIREPHTYTLSEVAQGAHVGRGAAEEALAALVAESKVKTVWGRGTTWRYRYQNEDERAAVDAREAQATRIEKALGELGIEGRVARLILGTNRVEISGDEMLKLLALVEKASA